MELVVIWFGIDFDPIQILNLTEINDAVML